MEYLLRCGFSFLFNCIDDTIRSGLMSMRDIRACQKGKFKQVFLAAGREGQSFDVVKFKRVFSTAGAWMIQLTCHNIVKRSLVCLWVRVYAVRSCN
jgi:hypothetical protein